MIKKILAGIVPTLLLCAFYAIGTIYVHPAFGLMVVGGLAAILLFGFVSYLLGEAVLKLLQQEHSKENAQ